MPARDRARRDHSEGGHHVFQGVLNDLDERGGARERERARDALSFVPSHDFLPRALSPLFSLQDYGRVRAARSARGVPCACDRYDGPHLARVDARGSVAIVDFRFQHVAHAIESARARRRERTGVDAPRGGWELGRPCRRARGTAIEPGARICPVESRRRGAGRNFQYGGLFKRSSPKSRRVLRCAAPLAQNMLSYMV